jgi:hypothetical protein
MVHYTSKDLVLKLVTLRCTLFGNLRHTENASIVKDLLVDAVMSYENVLVYVTDNVSNAITVARDLGVHHQGCVAHSLNTVVQKLMQRKRSNTSHPRNNNSGLAKTAFKNSNLSLK